MIQYLLDNDASLRFTNKSGKKALDLAEEIGSAKAIQDLLRKREDERERAFEKARGGNGEDEAKAK